MRTGLLILLLAAAGATQAPGFEGTWRGTSTCVDQKTDTACRNEQVIYVVTMAAGRKDSANVSASKIVNGTAEPMGDLGMRWDPKTNEWAMEFTPRGIHARWAFRPSGDRLTGSLTELPSGRLVRRVEASRAKS